jgi:hypothetical protein
MISGVLACIKLRSVFEQSRPLLVHGIGELHSLHELGSRLIYNRFRWQMHRTASTILCFREALDRIEHGERNKIQSMYVKCIVQKCHGLRAATLKSTKLNLNGATTSPISPLLRS